MAARSWSWVKFDFLLITDCRCLEQSNKSNKINNGFVSRLSLKLQEFPGMSLYWREGGSPELHMPDMLSRALVEYDGSKTPDLQGYEGPYYYSCGWPSGYSADTGATGH